jgi:hypothetical protein
MPAINAQSLTSRFHRELFAPAHLLSVFDVADVNFFRVNHNVKPEITQGGAA